MWRACEEASTRRRCCVQLSAFLSWLRWPGLPAPAAPLGRAARHPRTRPTMPCRASQRGRTPERLLKRPMFQAGALSRTVCLESMTRTLGVCASARSRRTAWTNGCARSFPGCRLGHSRRAKNAHGVRLDGAWHETFLAQGLQPPLRRDQPRVTCVKFGGKCG